LLLVPDTRHPAGPILARPTFESVGKPVVLTVCEAVDQPALILPYADLEEVCRLTAEGETVTVPDLLKRT